MRMIQAWQRQSVLLLLVMVLTINRFCVAFTTTTMPPSRLIGARLGIQNGGYSSALYSSATRKSSSAAASASSSSKKRSNKKSKVPDTGGLRRLPVVRRSSEIISRARKDSWNVKPDTTIKNARTRARKHGAEKLDAVSKSLCLPLRHAVDGYRRELRRLHPFERVVADLTARARQMKDGITLSDVLDEIHEGRKELLLSGKDWIASAKNAETARDAAIATAEGEDRMCDLFHQVAAAPLDSLIELQKSLRTVPAVRLDTPAVVLVGAPNVGKSSIVRAISSATPEVNNYPFTTRGMTLGHVEIFWDDSRNGGEVAMMDTSATPAGKEDSFVKGGSYAYSQLCQIMDSPGLLVRPDTERNEMEALTLAAMMHLPTAVMYVMDFSGEAGDRCSSIEDQLTLRREVRARFPRRPWIDVVSKVDLGVVDEAREGLEAILKEEEELLGKERKYINLSIQDNLGVEELRDDVMNMLGEVKVVLDAMAMMEAQQSNANDDS